MTGLADLISEVSRRQPEAPALADSRRVLTHGALDLDVRRTASRLRRAGLGVGARVGLCLRNSVDHAVVMLALFRLGAVMVPIDWRAKPDECARAGDAFALAAVLVEPGRGRGFTVPVLTMDEEWRATLAGETPESDGVAGGSMPLALNLSSGTTATARAAYISHEAMRQRLECRIQIIGPEWGRRLLCVMPIGFAAGREQLLRYLLMGGSAWIHPGMVSVDEILRLVRDSAVDTLFLPPPIIRRLLEAAPSTGHLLAGIGSLSSGADMLAVEEKLAVVEKITPNFFEHFSNSMTGPISILCPGDVRSHADSVGRPLPGIDVEVVNEGGRAVAPGEIGQLRLRGPTVVACHLGADLRPVADDAFRDGWFHPGDLATIGEDGFLRLRGRTANVIKRGGVSLYAEEIEPVLKRHPGVVEAVIVGRPVAGGDEEVVAFYESDGTVDEASLRAHCRESLAGFKIPDRFVARDALPRTATGKVNRGEMKEAAGRLGEGEGRRP